MDKKNNLNEIYRVINLTEYEKAIELILKEIKFSGAKPDLLLLLAETYLKNHDIKNAIKIFENLFNSDKNNPLYAFKLIELKIQTGLLADAKALLSELSNNLKEDWQYYFLSGRLHYELRNFENALSFLKEALKKNTKNLEIVILLADISYYIGKAEDAIRYYLAVLKLDANNFKAYENLGFLYYKLNKKRESFKAFSKANKLKPNSPNILKMLGLFEIEEGLYKDALRNLERAYNLDPDSIDILVFLGYTYEKLGVFEQAEHFYYKATTVSKQNPEPYIHLCNLYLKQDLPKKALQILSEAENKFPSNEKIKIEMGKCYLQLKEIEKAKKYFNQVLLVSAKSEEALFGLGFCQELLGDLNLANEYYTKLLEINPENFDGLLRKGIIEFSIGEKSAAQYYLSKLLEIDQNNFDANVILGQLKLEEQQLVDALYYLEKAKKIDSNNLQPYLILGEYYRNNSKLKEAIDEYSAVLDLSKYKSIESIEQFNDILENYENIISKYNNEIKSRNLAILNKFKEKNLELINQEKEIENLKNSIDLLFDQVDETIGTSFDELDKESSEYEIISKILDGNFSEEANIKDKEESSKILDYLADGVFAPEELEEKAEEIVIEKSKKDEEKLYNSEEVDTDIFEKIPLESLKNKSLPDIERNQKLSDDEDLSLLSQLKKDNIPSSLDEAYNLNESDNIKNKSNIIQPNTNEIPFQMQPQQKPIISTPQYVSPQYISVQYPQQYPQQVPTINPSYTQPLNQTPSFSSEDVSSQNVQNSPITIPENVERPPRNLANPSNDYSYRTYPSYIPPQEPAEKKSSEMPQNKNPKISDSASMEKDEEINEDLLKETINNEEIPEFPFEVEEKVDKIEPEKKKRDIPDYFEPIESMTPNDIGNEDLLQHPVDFVEESKESEVEEVKNFEKFENSADSFEKLKGKNGVINLGVLAFGKPNIELVKNLIQTKPKSLKEKKVFLSKSIRELGKYFFIELTNLPRDLQEKATLSKNFQTFINFMKKENKNA